MNEQFHVGDRVVRDGNYIGKIIRITPTGQIVVEFSNNYTERFTKNGRSMGSDIWNHSYIKLLTPEIEQHIHQQEIIAKCKRIFSDTKLTYAQASAILQILSNTDSH